MTTVSLPSLRRLLVAALALAVGWSVVVLHTNDLAGSAGYPRSVPVAKCGKGSLPETGMQGRVSTEDYDSGRAAKGFRCNARLVSRVPGTGGFKVLRYTDTSGHTCAFFDSTRFFPTDAAMQLRDGFGVIVVDMTDPAKPREDDDADDSGDAEPARVAAGPSRARAARRGDGQRVRERRDAGPLRRARRLPHAAPAVVDPQRAARSRVRLVARTGTPSTRPARAVRPSPPST